MLLTLLHRLLDRPEVYNLSQWLWYRRGQQQAYVQNWVRPRVSDRILDIGCGAAGILERLPPVQYVGYDPNPDYVRAAERRFGRRGIFRAGYLASLPAAEEGSFDLVLASGVLHHLADDQVRHLLGIAAQALKPEGRLVTRDGCYEPHQGFVARALMRMDRGSFVRTQTAYENLICEHFEILRAEIKHDALRLPYSLIHFEARKLP